jgi:hypothetical protein
MFQVQTKLLASDLPVLMGKMRDWLDANHIEAAGFAYVSGVAYLAFRMRRDASAFGQQFARLEERHRRRA